MLTIVSVKVSEAELRALVGDKDLSIESKDHGLILHVNHASHHVTLAPCSPKEVAAHVYPSTLQDRFYFKETPECAGYPAEAAL